MTETQLRALLNVEADCFRHGETADDGFSRGMAAGIRVAMRITGVLERQPDGASYPRNANGELLTKEG